MQLCEKIVACLALFHRKWRSHGVARRIATSESPNRHRPEFIRAGDILASGHNDAARKWRTLSLYGGINSTVHAPVSIFKGRREQVHKDHGAARHEGRTTPSLRMAVAVSCSRCAGWLRQDLPVDWIFYFPSCREGSANVGIVQPLCRRSSYWRAGLWPRLRPTAQS